MIPSALTQKEIIQGCKDGREEAYRALVDIYAEQLMGTCLRYLRDSQKAEDVLQETYIRVFKSIHKYEEMGSLTGWLTKIAVNCCLKELKKNKRISAQEEELRFENSIELPEIYEKLSAEDLLVMLDRLPEHYRIIFNLNIIEGYTHKEIADMLGIQISLSRTKLTRARKLLQEYYSIQFKKSIV